MASSEKRIVATQVPTATTTEVYLAPAARIATVRKFLVANQSGSDENIDIHIAADGGAAATTNLVFDQVLVGGGETRAFNLAGQDIPKGGKVYVKGDTPNACNVFITLDERDQNNSGLYS
jgi:hypothetical protein